MAKLFFHTVWIPAVRYTLAQSFLSDDQFQSIDKKVSRLLGKFGYSMRQSRSITEAPIRLGGCGCPSAYSMASSGYILHLLKNFRSPDELAGGTFRIVISRFQQAAGISKPIFEYPSLPLPYVSGVICQAIRRYLVDIDAIVRIRPNFVPPKLRVNDKAIMDILLDNDHSFDTVQMQQINSCRLYLGVTYLSEICNIKGTHLVDGINDGDTTNLLCTPLQDKIYQPYPSTKSWALWDLLLQYVTEDANPITEDANSTKLITPLGSFTKDHSTNNRWKGYRNQSLAYIFNDDTSLWQQYNVTQHNQLRITNATAPSISYQQ